MLASPIFEGDSVRIISRDGELVWGPKENARRNPLPPAAERYGSRRRVQNGQDVWIQLHPGAQWEHYRYENGLEVFVGYVTNPKLIEDLNVASVVLPQGSGLYGPHVQRNPAAENPAPAALPNPRWTRKYKDQLPDSAFLIVDHKCATSRDARGRSHPLSCRHLPYRDKAGNINLPHLRNAIGRAPQTTSVPMSVRRAAQAKGQRLLAQIEGPGRGREKRAKTATRRRVPAAYAAPNPAVMPAPPSAPSAPLAPPSAAKPNPHRSRSSQTLLEKGYVFQFTMEDGKTISFPRYTWIMLHDPSGKLWPRCEVLFTRAQLRPGNTVSNPTAAAKAYYGDVPIYKQSLKIPPKTGVAWKPVGTCVQIYYDRTGHAEDPFHHEFDSRQYPQLDTVTIDRRKFWRLTLGPACSINERGYVWP